MKLSISIIVISVLILGVIFSISRKVRLEHEQLPVIEKAADFELINQDDEKIFPSQFIGKLKVMSFFLHEM